MVFTGLRILDESPSKGGEYKPCQAELITKLLINSWPHRAPAAGS